MKYLVDTCVFVWAYGEPEHLLPAAESAMADKANVVLLSTVSSWELAIKQSVGKFELGDLPTIVAEELRDNAYILVPVELPHVYRTLVLPSIHKDPFDRMLICQALAEGATIITPDHLIRQYPVPTLW